MAEETAVNLRAELQERMDENYQDFMDDWMCSSREELIYDADFIYAAKLVYENVMDYIRDEDIPYLLQFSNPLELLRDSWMTVSAINISDLKECVHYVQENDDMTALYEKSACQVPFEQMM